LPLWSSLIYSSPPRRRCAGRASTFRIPTSDDPGRNYQWATMEGGSTGGYFAIRMKSDI
jgi:hypothetical protein